MQNRYSLPRPLRPHRRGGCCVRGVTAANGSVRPDASGSRPRAHCTASGGGASSRKAAELHRIVSPPTTTDGPTDAPSYREEMRERSGSHGRRRYALRQGQRLPPAGPAQPEPQNQPRQQTAPVRLGNGTTDPAQVPHTRSPTLTTMRPCAQLPTSEPPQ